MKNKRELAKFINEKFEEYDVFNIEFNQNLILDILVKFEELNDAKQKHGK